jgi:hypothetical protein
MTNQQALTTIKYLANKLAIQRGLIYNSSDSNSSYTTANEYFDSPFKNKVYKNII